MRGSYSPHAFRRRLVRVLVHARDSTTTRPCIPPQLAGWTLPRRVVASAAHENYHQGDNDKAKQKKTDSEEWPGVIHRDGVGRDCNCRLHPRILPPHENAPLEKPPAANQTGENAAPFCHSPALHLV